MKKLLFLLMLPLFSFMGPKETVKIKTSAICEMCKERIEKNLALTKGVAKSDLNLDDKVITVEFDAAKIDAAGIKKVISESGYDADDVKAVAKDYAKLPNCCKKKD
jgi:periplasmic mercuric ion binding protein